MTLKEKQQLVTLLEMYKAEQFNKTLENIEAVEKAKKQGKRAWEVPITHGCKAKYERARIMSTQISKEVNDEMPADWQL